MSKIFNIYGTDYHSMTKKLLDESNAIKLVNGSVALKPNLVVSGTPDNGATTHSEILSGCLEYFIDNGVKDLSVIEGSWVAADTMKAMKRAGYDKVCEKYNVPFYDLKRDKTRSVETPIGKIEICCKALDVGLLVNLPVLKGHCQTVMTCALKNLKGCLPDREKRRFHSLGLTKPIAALGAALKNQNRLIIVDNICGDLDFEEGGNPVQTDRIFLGTDPVMIDSYGCGLMGLEIDDVKYIKLAEKFGAGETKFSPENILYLNEPENAKKITRPSGTVAGLIKNVHEDSACSACYASLVRALYLNPELKHEKIYIGQGWRNKKIPDDGLGIGNCCKNASRFIKGCPPSAKEIINKNV